MEDGLLIEILSEELPPRSLSRLSEVFGTNLYDYLSDAGLLSLKATEYDIFATPRRLAAYFPRVRLRQENRESVRRGPKEDAPIEHVQGFARGCGVSIEQLEKTNGFYCHKRKVKGEPASNLIPEIVNKALKNLPVSKTMRWGSGETQFVRPVHGIILLHGKKVIPGTVLGLKSGNQTLGHRFLSKSAIAIPSAKDYVRLLKQRGKVVASFEARRELIAKTLDAAAHKVGKGVRWDLGKSAELVDEVTSIVEYPVVLAGSFDKTFLDVPKECLVISMQQHQKYFPLVDTRGELLPNFLFVSNMQATNPKDIIHGNERVLRARLSDARFFFDQDRKTKLEERVPRLANVVYHNKLGSQLQRVQRLQKLAGQIARLLLVDVTQAERAATLAKADLLTDMVGEFPELQGIMGRYYARHDGETPAVAVAIEQHYLPKTAGDALPEEAVAICVALADKLDTLTGIFGIGLAPSGDKDPFGLRRAALGVVRILAEKSLALDVLDLLTLARGHFPAGVVADSVAQDLHGFMLERLKPYLRDQGFEVDEIDAIVSLNPTRFDQVLPRLKALQAFRMLPQAEALAAANKRIRNILKQAGGAPAAAVDPALLREPAEQQLAQEVEALRAQVQPLFRAGNYAAALQALALLRPAVDAFFDKVMVMAEDTALRHNRLALLNSLSELFLGAADISRLQS